MTRRSFLALTAGLVACPWAVRAQLGSSVQIGMLYPGFAAMTPTRIAALRDGLRAVGLTGADRMDISLLASEGVGSRLAALADQLVARKVTAIVAVSPSAVRAAKAATSTIPIVANDLESDPVANGFVDSLAHPGGNVTGVFSDFPEFGTKWLELLREAIPELSYVVALWDPATGPTQRQAVTNAARLLNVRFDVVDVREVGELGSAFRAASELKPTAIVILSSPIFGTNPRQIADLTIEHRIPTATLFSEIARAGSLMSYGPNLLDTFRQTGTMLGKVLQGAKPADLPLERPTKFEMVINLRTAKALGLAVSTSLLLRADEVVE